MDIAQLHVTINLNDLISVELINVYRDYYDKLINGFISDIVRKEDSVPTELSSLILFYCHRLAA